MSDVRIHAWLVVAPVGQSAATAAGFLLAGLQRLAGVPIPCFAERHDQARFQLHNAVGIAGQRQQKERLSERLAQQHELALGEVETLAKAVLNELKIDLKKRVNDELNTTVGAIRDGIEGLPQQITESADPLKEVLEQARSEANTLKLISSVWLKALLVGVCTSVGIGLGSWGVLSWMGSEVQRLNSEISSAKATLAQLPTGVTFVHQGGKSYILAPTLGQPFNVKDSDKMAVEVK